MDLPALATACFTGAPGVASPTLALQLAQLDWRLVASQPQLAARALMVVVALARVAAAGGGSAAEGWEAATANTLLAYATEVLGGGGGGFSVDEGECYLLCMLEVRQQGLLAPLPCGCV